MPRTRKVDFEYEARAGKAGSVPDPGSTQYSEGVGDLGHLTPDELLPVKNMADWGCDGKVIKAPVYADRAYQLCCPVDVQQYQKISGQIRNSDDPPSMLQKAAHKKPYFRTPMTQSTPGKQLADWGAGEEKQTPFRKKGR
jgi:hypothetical protein